MKPMDKLKFLLIRDWKALTSLMQHLLFYLKRKDKELKIIKDVSPKNTH